MTQKHLIRIVLLFILMLGLMSIVQAQNTISYGSTTNAQLTADVPQVFYTFSGTTGNIVTIYALGWSEGFQPTISLLSSTGQPLAFSNEDPLTPISNDARITLRLPSDGVYSLLVSSENNTTGTFTLSLYRTAPVISTVLSDSVTLNIPAGAPELRYSINADANTVTNLTIRSLSPDFDFRASLSNPDGDIIAVIVGGLDAVTLTIPAGEGTYELVVAAADAQIGGEIEISFSGSSSSDTSSPTSAPQATEPSVVTDPNACVVTGENVNVRSGPSTEYPSIGALNSSNQLIASGQNNGWYSGDYNGQTGWVFSGVVNTTGSCNGLAFVEAPPVPTAAPENAITTEEATATEETTATEEATATEESTATEETTVTEEVQQTAPEDSNISSTYNIKSDSGQTVSSSISYPNGDTSDAVNYTITGYDSVTQRAELRWTLFCNGDTAGVEFLRGNRVVGGCNSSYTEFINAGNGSGGGNASAGFNIRYTSGSNSYVEWELRMETLSCAPRDC